MALAVMRQEYAHMLSEVQAGQWAAAQRPCLSKQALQMEGVGLDVQEIARLRPLSRPNLCLLFNAGTPHQSVQVPCGVGR